MAEQAPKVITQKDIDAHLSEMSIEMVDGTTETVMIVTEPLIDVE